VRGDRKRARVRGAIVVAALAGAVSLLGSLAPAKALMCTPELDQACRLVFGTYCMLTHEYPCFP
jgi:hypothetical protein